MTDAVKMELIDNLRVAARASASSVETCQLMEDAAAALEQAGEPVAGETGLQSPEGYAANRTLGRDAGVSIGPRSLNGQGAIEVMALAFAKSFYGPSFDPFQNPEAYDMAEKATLEALAAAEDARIGQEFDAGQAVEAMRAACIAAVRAEQKYEGSDFPVCNAIVREIEAIPAHPPQSRGQAFDGEGEACKPDRIKARADAIAHLTVPEDGNYKDNREYRRHFRIARDAALAAFEEVAVLSSAKRGEG